jgi:hypothetical protein
MPRGNRLSRSIQGSLNALKALLIAGAGVGLPLDGFRGYQLLRRGPRGGIADEP